METLFRAILRSVASFRIQTRERIAKSTKEIFFKKPDPLILSPTFRTHAPSLSRVSDLISRQTSTFESRSFKNLTNIQKQHVLNPKRRKAGWVESPAIVLETVIVKAAKAIKSCRDGYYAKLTAFQVLKGREDDGRHSDGWRKPDKGSQAYSSIGQRVFRGSCVHCLFFSEIEVFLIFRNCSQLWASSIRLLCWKMFPFASSRWSSSISILVSATWNQPTWTSLRKLPRAWISKWSWMSLRQTTTTWLHLTMVILRTRSATKISWNHRQTTWQAHANRWASHWAASLNHQPRRPSSRRKPRRRERLMHCKNKSRRRRKKGEPVLIANARWDNAISAITRSTASRIQNAYVPLAESAIENLSFQLAANYTRRRNTDCTRTKGGVHSRFII